MEQHHRPRSAVEPETIPTDTTDPVCGMTVDPERAAGTFDYEGRRYLFCSPSCLTRFQATPEQYIRHRSMGEAHAAPMSCPQGRPSSIPVRCIRRSVNEAQVPVQSVAWHSIPSPWRPR